MRWLLIPLFAFNYVSAAFGQEQFVDFEQFIGPSVFSGVRAPITVGVATFSGGQILRQTTFMPVNRSTIYGSAYFCPGCSPTLTISFSQPVSDFSVFLMNGQVFTVTYTVQDDRGGITNRALLANFQSGAGTITLPSEGIRAVTIRGSASQWDFFIDKVRFNATPNIRQADLICRPLDPSADDPTSMRSKLGKHCYFLFTAENGDKTTFAAHDDRISGKLQASTNGDPTSPPGGCDGGALASDCLSIKAPSGKTLADLFSELELFDGQSDGNYDRIDNNSNLWAKRRLEDLGVNLSFPTNVITNEADFCRLKSQISSDLQSCGVSFWQRMITGFYGYFVCQF